MLTSVRHFETSKFARYRGRIRKLATNLVSHINQAV